MASDGSFPPPIAEVREDLKFDGGFQMGWSPVKRRIENALRAEGLHGYIDDSIKKPTTAPRDKPPLPAPTAIYSSDPSLEEWKFRNDRAKCIIESHIIDLLSLIPDADEKTAYELMSALNDDFKASDEFRMMVTERKLRSHVFRETEPLDDFFRQLRVLRREATEAGNTIDDAAFRRVVLAAFPTKSFDMIIRDITSTDVYKTSGSVIQQITLGYASFKDHSGNVAAGTAFTPQAHAAAVARIAELEKILAAMSTKGKSGKKW